MQIFVVAVFFLAGIACQSDCVCTSLKIEDQRTGWAIGDCLARDSTNDQYYCYVSFNSGCYDKARSSRANGLFYSYQACRNRPSGVAAADISPI